MRTIPPTEEVRELPPVAVVPTTLLQRPIPSPMRLAAEAFRGARQALQMGPTARMSEHTQMGSVSPHPVSAAANREQADTQLGAREALVPVTEEPRPTHSSTAPRIIFAAVALFSFTRAHCAHYLSLTSLWKHTIGPSLEMISQMQSMPPFIQGGAEAMAPQADVHAAEDGVPVTCEGLEEVLVADVLAEKLPDWHI